MEEWLKYGIRLIVVILLQALLIDHLQWMGICHPQVYILCLLMFPIRLPEWVDMLIGALIGLVMDLYANSLGIHISACIAVMYFRRLLIPHLVSDSERVSTEINSASIGTIAFVKMVVYMVLLHHTWVGMLHAWSIHRIGITLVSVLFSSLITIAIIIGYDKIHTV